MAINEEIIKFKSAGLFYESEKSGLKCCTIREIDMSEKKHQLLAAMKITGYLGFIEIHKLVCPSKHTFKRRITYIEYWKNLIIICWKHPNSQSNEKGEEQNGKNN